MAIRVTRFMCLMVASWIVMTFTHEMGHIIGGTCCGGSLQSADLLPWHLPYSIFDPDPFPLVTLWAGLIIGVLAPVAVAMIIQRDWMWFIANFCLLANGAYIAAAWFSGDRYLDTARLLEHGASPIAIGLYCLLTIGFGYVGFRQSCVSALSAPTKLETEKSQTVDEQIDARKSPVGRNPESCFSWRRLRDRQRCMPQQQPESPIASTLATLAGCTIVFGSLLLTLAFPDLHVGIAIAIGSVLGTPLIVLGLRLHPQSSKVNEPSRQFWPTRTESRSLLWGFVASLTLLAFAFGPIFLLVSLGYLLPSGDHWGIVTIRLVFVAFAIGGYSWWFKFASRTFPNLFRGRLSDETLNAFTRNESIEQHKTAVAAATKNWPLLFIALVAFCLALGVIDFDSPWLNIDAGPKRTRGLVRLVQWCRGNPNTVTSSAVIVGTAALAWYVLQLRRAAAHPDDPGDSRHVTKR